MNRSELLEKELKSIEWDINYHTDKVEVSNLRKEVLLKLIEKENA